MEFPRLVYIGFGKKQRAGGTYDHEIVESKEEYDAAIKAGFYGSLPEAVEAHENREPSTSEEVDKPRRGRPPKKE